MARDGRMSDREIAKAIADANQAIRRANEAKSQLNLHLPQIDNHVIIVGNDQNVTVRGRKSSRTETPKISTASENVVQQQKAKRGEPPTVQPMFQTNYLDSKQKHSAEDPTKLKNSPNNLTHSAPPIEYKGGFNQARKNHPDFNGVDFIGDKRGGWNNVGGHAPFESSQQPKDPLWFRVMDWFFRLRS